MKREKEQKKTNEHEHEFAASIYSLSAAPKRSKFSGGLSKIDTAKGSLLDRGRRVGGEMPQIIRREFSPRTEIRFVALHRGNASDSLGAAARRIHWLH